MKAADTKPVWFLLTQHWLTLAGMTLVTTAVLSWLFVLPQQIRGHADNPYVGIIIFLVLPLVFFAGLALIPTGIYLSKRRLHEQLTAPALDRKTAIRRIAWFFAVTTLINILVGTQLTYRAVKHMETPQFCGASCHTMNPEFAAYRDSPHSRVECVECHVAPGAEGWVTSKASGIRQLIETVLRTSPKPIPSAIESNRLVPARETCENCHWPQKFEGVRLRVITKYADDEANTRSQTVLLMLIGGDLVSGIHGAHLGPGVQIHFVASDPARQTISWVEYRNTTTGQRREYRSEDWASHPLRDTPIIEMQCVDCHNRPTHGFELPDRALDEALSLGQMPVGLPFVKKEGIELLKASYATNAEATDKIPKELQSYYRQHYPTLFEQRATDVQRAAQALIAIYNRNVFPDLKVSWGTYPNNLGHTDFPGCFRCHDGGHATPEGESITADCNTCHETLASDESSPDILKKLGIAERIAAIQKQ